MSNLDGVVGDARKRIEPAWVAGMESQHQPVCGCALHKGIDHARMSQWLRAGLIRLAELPSSDPT